ncbi:MAG: hypothetical protein ACRCU0_04645 [Candidatus Rhabdochlamydia sp.]
MNEINNRIVRTEVLPMPEEAKRKFEEFGKAFGKKKVKEEDSLVRDFVKGMLFGALAAPVFIFYAYQSQLSPKSADWKVNALACAFFAATCAVVARCLGFKNLVQFNRPLNPVIISNSLIKK